MEVRGALAVAARSRPVFASSFARPHVKLFDPVPPRKILPNLITASAMSFGMASVFVSVSALVVPDPAVDLQRAAWFVLLSTLLDKLDGSVARLIRGQSEFGVQFDSFADCIAFGLAPAALVYTTASRLAPDTWGAGATLLGLPAQGLLAGICLTYAVMTAVRLARFNVMTDTIGPSIFLGLPSTLSGGLLCSGFLTIFELNQQTPRLFALFPLLLALNAALMVCNLPLPKMKFSSGATLVKAGKIAAAAVVYAAIIAQKGYTAVLVLLLGYLLLGFAWFGPRMVAAGAQNRAV
jgi:CDP-diacylglycerol--serine O-phosphatidyltransferase